jgi:hypothetical protein
VAAIDCNPFSIDHLASIAPANLQAELGNFESIRFGKQFDMAMLKSCVLNTVSSESRRKFFATARASLRRGGILIVEIYQLHWLKGHGRFVNGVQDFSFAPLSETACRIKAEYYCGDVVYALTTTAELIGTEDVTRLALNSDFSRLREHITLNPLSRLLVFD